MKRIRLLSFFLGSLFVVFPAVLSAQSVLVDLGSASGAAGATVQVPVHIRSSGGARPAGLQVDVSFNTSSLTFTRSVTGDAASAAGKSASSSTLSPGLLRLIVAGINQNVIADGVVALLEFQISGGAGVSTSTLTATDSRVTDPQAQTVSSSAGIGLVIIGGGIATPSTIYFPQIADGGGFVTSFVIVNPGNSAVSALLQLFRQDGTAAVFNLNGNLDNAFRIDLPARGLVILESSNYGPVLPGWARLLSSAAIGGSIVYAFATGPDTVISEAGINPSTAVSSFSLSVDTRRGFSSGLAVANPNTQSVTLTLTLYDRNGNQLSQKTRVLEGLKQFAELEFQLFDDVNLSNFTGVIRVTATGGQVTGTTLRFNGTLSVFASIPVI